MMISNVAFAQDVERESGKIALYSKDLETAKVKGKGVVNVQAFLEAKFGKKLEYKYDKKSPMGKHFAFSQRHVNFPIFNTDVKINLKHSGEIFSITGYVINVEDCVFEPSVDIDEEQLVKKFLLNAEKPFEVIEEPFFTWYVQEEPQKNLSLCLHLMVKNIQTGKQYAYLILEDASVVHEYEMQAYYHDSHAECAIEKDTTGTGMVFNPDPLTTAGVSYGGAYIDNADADSDALNEQRVLVNLDIEVENGQYVLKNDIVSVENLEDPFNDPATSTDGNFDFTRSQSGFEEVMVLYHVTTIQKYIQSLGFDDLCSARPLSIDAHGTEDDNSFYRYGSNPSIILGDGGVDDAEDADVIIHEYGHGLSNCASPNTNSGSNERNALDEAFGDYFATSYSRKISDVAWGKMFTWDGHNEYWSGRNVDNDLVYPNDLTGNYFSDSQIFSAAMIDLWELLGTECADKLVLQLLYFSTRQTDFQEAAQTVFELAKDLPCAESKTLNVYKILFDRGLLEIAPLEVPNIIKICWQDTVTITPSILIEEEGAKYRWTGPNIEGDNDAKSLVATPSTNTFYQIEMMDADDNLLFIDTVNVEIEYCGEELVEAINLENVDQQNSSFLTNEDIYFLIRDDIDYYSIQVTDLQGRIVYNSVENIYFYHSLPTSLLTAGMYIINIVGQDSNGKEVKWNKKVVKNN